MDMRPSLEAPRKTASIRQVAPLKIHALTSVRFFAAVYVILFHSQSEISPHGYIAEVLKLGYIGPYFFFALSGYILSLVYLQRGESIDIRRFFVARFARIYPLYVVSLLLDIPFAVAARVARYGVLFASVRVGGLFARSCIMLQMFAPADNALNIPSWTIAIEAVFYLTFPWLGPRIWKLSGRAALLALCGLCVGGVALDRLIVFTRGNVLPATHLVSFLTVFAAGICLARWQAVRQQAQGAGHRNHTMGWIAILTAALIFFPVVSMRARLISLGLNPPYLLTPVFLALIWFLTQDNNYATRWLNAKWLVVLGEASYALYLLQNPVGNTMRRLGLAGAAWDFPLYLCVCTSLSVLSFYFFETPCRRWILRRFHTPTKETMEAASSAQ